MSNINLTSLLHKEVLFIYNCIRVLKRFRRTQNKSNNCQDTFRVAAVKYFSVHSISAVINYPFEGR